MGAETGRVMGRTQRRLVFTYGTLKKGFYNHRLMEDLLSSGDASFVGTYRTSEKYPLVCGPYRVPFLLNMPGKGHHVFGEVYRVSDVGLARLDELEGTTRGHYQRLPISVEHADDAAYHDAESGGGGGDGVEAYFAHPSYAQQMWAASGEKGIVCYSHKEAVGYVKRQDRPSHLSFLDHISDFVSSSSLPHSC